MISMVCLCGRVMSRAFVFLNLKMAESLECDSSENLETDKTNSVIIDKNLDLGSNTNVSVSLEGSVVASPSIESFSTLPEAESSLTLNDETPDLVVKVDNPEKHFDLLDTYITFRVSTKTTRPEFEEKNYSVRRRYNDFVWLRQRLVDEYPTHFVPPLPVKHTLIEQLDRYGKEFVTTRMTGLQSFLYRLVRHPILSCASCFKVFLTASTENFQHHRKVTATTLFSKVSDSFNTFSTMYFEPQRTPELEKLNEYLAILPEKLSHICKISQRIHKERAEEVMDLAELKSVLQHWAGSESDLTDPLCEVASAVDKTKQSLQNVLLDTENFILIQPMKEYLLYIDAIKEALERRDNIEINYLHLVESLEKKKQEKEELESESNDHNILTSWTKTSPETKSERLEKLNQIIPEYQQQVEEARDKLEVANENIRSDLERWSQEKKTDLKNILITFAEQHISHYEQFQGRLSFGMHWRHPKRRHLCHALRIRVMLCCGRRKEGREGVDMAASPRRQQPGNQNNRTKNPPPMVIQGDFRKVSGISTEIFRQIEQVENDHDATTAAALETVDRRGEMVVRILDPRSMGKYSFEAAKRFLQMQDAKHIVQMVEIVKRPGQTLGLYIREGNGMDRSDGVFISRIALESAVYNSGCLQVGDEILAVNLVDVTRMSLDDVVIIMSIPRRLVLAIRQRKGVRGAQPSPLLSSRESKPPPVVVIKKHFEDLDRDDNGIEERREREREHERQRERERFREREIERERERRPRSRLGLGFSQLPHDHSEHNGLDLYYNSRPENSSDQWTYRPPPPPVITEQPKPQHFTPYDRQYPKTLESLAEKVHSFYPSGPLDNRRGSPAYSSLGAGGTHDIRRIGNRIMPRSGSDQHLPRVEYDYGNKSRLGARQSSTLLRSSLKSNTLGHSGYTSRFMDPSRCYMPSYALTDSVSKRSKPPVDYSSDTEATIGPRSYYTRRGLSAGLTSTGLTRIGVTPVSSLRSNSLPRDQRGRSQLGQISRQSLVRFDRNLACTLLGDDDSDGALSAPEFPSKRERDRISSTPSVFTSDEYRAWLSRVPITLLPRSSSTLSRTGSHGLSSISRTPSTSAIYERIRAGREAITQQRAQRFTFSAENLSLLDRHREDSRYYSYKSPLSSTLDRPRPASTTPLSSSQSLLRTSDLRDKAAALKESADKNLRRIRQLMELESGHIPNPSPRLQTDPRSRLLDINPAEFLKYKMEKSSLQNSSSISSLHSHADITSGDLAEGMYGLLWVHLLAGRGLRASTSTTTQTIGGTTTGLRDLYCVLECDRVHKARTVVRTGDIVFDWDETFELDLIGNRELDLLIYSWDPQYRHKLCYKGSVHLVSLLKQSSVHQLALKIEPRGTLYLRLKYTDPQTTFSRKPSQQHILARPGSKPILTGGLFGGTLESAVNRETVSILPSGIAPSSMPISHNVPLIIKRCVEEIERRGLDIIGLYRLCGSATKKRILREGFERNARTVDLTPDNVPDINVITGVLKDYLRELPEPLFTKCLYQMLVDVISVCLPDDPEGNAKLIFSILDCLPKVNRATLIFLMDHLSLVVSQSDRNKMTAQNLSVIFGPILMLHTEPGTELDFNQPITVLKYLLEIWKHQSGALFSSTRDRHSYGASPLTRQSQLPQHMTTSKPAVHGVQDKSHTGPVVVTSPGSPASESSRSSSSISHSEGDEILSGSKALLNNKNLSLLSNKSPYQMSLLGSNSSITNKSPSQISLLGSNSSINSLTRSNVSIPDSKNAYSSGSMLQSNIRNSPLLDRSKSPYGSPNLSDRSRSPYLQSSKSPYGSPILDKTRSSFAQNLERSKSPVDKTKSPFSSPNLNNREVTKSPLLKNGDYSSQTLDRYGTKTSGNDMKGNLERFSSLSSSVTSSQICDSTQQGEKPLFSTLPRQRSIPTIIGMPRRLMDQRKSLPQVQTVKTNEFVNNKPESQAESKNPFEKLEGFTVSANPTGKNPFLDETEDQYNYENVSSRVISFEQKAGNGNDKENTSKLNPYLGFHTAQNAMYQTSIGQCGTVVTTSIPQSQIYAGSVTSLQYSIPVSSGMTPKKHFQTPTNNEGASQYRQKTSNQVVRKEQKTQEPRYDSTKLGYDLSKTGTIHEEVIETPTPSSSTGTDSPRKEMGQEGDVESNGDEIEIAEKADVVPELGRKMF